MNEPEQQSFRGWLLNGILTLVHRLWKGLEVLIRLPVRAAKYVAGLPRDSLDFALGFAGFFGSIVFLFFVWLPILNNPAWNVSFQIFYIVIFLAVAICSLGMIAILHGVYLDETSPLVCPHCGYKDTVESLRCSKCGKSKRMK